MLLPDTDPHKTCGCVKAGECFYSILSGLEFSSSEIAECIKAFDPIFNCRNLSPGDEYEIKTNAKGNIVNLTIRTNSIGTFHLKKEDQKLIPAREKVYVNKKITLVSGVIEDSLFGAVIKAGEDDQLALDFADIFAWDIDFRHDLQKGDRFKIIVEKYYKDDKFLRSGKIKVAEYGSEGKTYRAIHFKDQEGKEGYFTPEGISVRRSFLRSPLRFTRISSGYSYHRFHPILKRIKPHLGVDFSAPPGTPVMSVGDGIIIEKRWKNGNGNTVSIRHPLGYETMYNHLSRFGKDIKVGKRVMQKDIIGYVGTTGLSTGPHLDYRMQKSGRFINPLCEKFPPGFPVDKASLKSFFEVSKQMIALLEKNDLPAQKMVAGR